MDTRPKIDALNGICPYFTMFPLDFPLGVLRNRKPGLVVDPYCGRGTTNLAARLCGFPTVGIDSSPVAAAATAAKVLSSAISTNEIVALAKELIAENADPEVPEGDFWSLAYRPEVLEQICAIRSGLINRPRCNIAKALRAIMLGALHGPKRQDGSSSYFSNQAPRTYAPKPRYAVSYWRRHKQNPPSTDVLQVVRHRALRAFGAELPNVKARVRCRDSRTTSWSDLLDEMGRIKWVVTSPPYYGLRSYRSDQWLREWYLGGSPKVDYRAKGQLEHGSPEIFADDLRKVWVSLAERAADSAHLVVRFGAINDRPVEPEDLICDSLEDSGWRVKSVYRAGRSSSGKRQAETFNLAVRPAVEEVDVWCRIE